MTTDFELANNQLLIWAGQQLWPEQAIYNVAFAFHIAGTLDPQRFERAFAAVLAGTDALRMVVTCERGEPKQRVREDSCWALEYVDLSDQPEADRACARWLADRVRRPLDPAVRSFDTVLLKLGAERFVWYLCQHHLFTDAVSASLLFARVARHYADVDTEVTYPQFGAHLERERDRRATPQYARAQAYWRAKLAERSAPLTFFGGPARTLATAPWQERLSVDLGLARTGAIREAARVLAPHALSENQAVFTLLAAVVCAFLHCASGQSRVALGIAAHGRVGRASANTVGLFVEQDPHHIAVERDDTFISLALKVQRESLEVMRHVPFAPSHPGGQAIEAGLNFITTRFGDFAGMPVRAKWLHPGAGDASFVAHFHDYSGCGRLQMVLDCNSTLFPAEARNRAADELLAILDACLERPARRMAELAGLRPPSMRDQGAAAIGRASQAADLHGFVNSLLRRGGSLRVVSGKLACRPPADGLSENEIAFLREHRDGLLDLLVTLRSTSANPP
ncbi:MAG: hypothetical protein DIU71_03415 [Proteobacteria bacterium]|nr:MAG: hypothetical protein DIU71_03415 [Pseudomonadota bacterium]